MELYSEDGSQALRGCESALRSVAWHRRLSDVRWSQSCSRASDEPKYRAPPSCGCGYSRALALMRPSRAITVIVMLVTGVPIGRAQSPSTTPSSQAALDEATQLNELVVKLHEEGKYQDAIAPAT